MEQEIALHLTYFANQGKRRSFQMYETRRRFSNLSLLISKIVKDTYEWFAVPDFPFIITDLHSSTWTGKQFAFNIPSGLVSDIYRTRLLLLLSLCVCSHLKNFLNRLFSNFVPFNCVTNSTRFSRRLPITNTVRKNSKKKICGKIPPGSIKS